MKKVISLSVVVLFPFLFTACQNKEVCKNYTVTYSVDKYILSYFASFKQGSYWIYEDSFGNIDSSYVISYSRLGGTTQSVCYWTGWDAKQPQYDDDQIFLTMHSSKNDSFLFYAIGNVTSINEMDTFLRCSISNKSYSTATFTPLLSPDDTSRGLHLLSLSSFNQKYSNVIEVYSKNANDWLPIYFAPNIGIVQKRIHGVTYNLVRYKIVS